MGISGTPEATGLAIGAWTSWTPTLTNLTLGDGTVVAEYAQIGKTVFYNFSFTLGSSSAVGTNPTFTPPVPMEATITSPEVPPGNVRCIDANAADWVGVTRRATADIALFYINASANQASITATAPFTWVATDTLTVSGFYRVA